MKKFNLVKKLIASGFALSAVMGSVSCSNENQNSIPQTETVVGDKGYFFLVEVNGKTWLIEAEKYQWLSYKDTMQFTTKDGKFLTFTDFVLLEEKPAEFFYDFEYGVDGTFTKPPVEQEMGD